MVDVLVEAQTTLYLESTQAVAGLNTYSTALSRTTKRMGEFIGKAGYVRLAMTRIATYTAIFTFIGALGKLLKDNIELEERLAEVTTLVSNKNTEQVDSLKLVTGELLKLSPYLGSSINLTKALYEIMSAGVNEPVQAFSLLVTTAKYAKAGLADFSTSAQTLTSVMKAYGLDAEAMKEKTDMLFQAVAEGKFHAQDLNEALGKVLPTAAAMGVGIDEVSAALAVASHAGLDVGEAATGLNRIFLSLLNPMQKSRDMLQQVGIHFGRDAFIGKGLVGVMTELTRAMRTHSDLLPVVFRRERALREAFLFTGKGLENLVAMLAKIRGATQGAGMVEEAYQKIIMTTGEEIKALAAEWQKAAHEVLGSMSVLSAFVRIFRDLGSTLIRGANALVILTGVWLTFGRAMLRARRLAVDLAMTVEWMHKRRYRKPESLLYMEAMETASAKAMKAARFWTFLTTAINVGIIAYIALKEVLRRVHEELDRQLVITEQISIAYRNAWEELKLLSAVWNETTKAAKEDVRDFNDEVRDFILSGVRAMFIEAGGGLKTFVYYLDLMKKAGFSQAEAAEKWNEGLGITIQKLIDGAELTRADRFEILNWAQSVGVATRRMKMFIDYMAENPILDKAWDAAEQRTLRWMRDYKAVADDITEGRNPSEIAEAMTGKEIEIRLKSLNEIMKAGSAEQLVFKDALKKSNITWEEAIKFIQKAIPLYEKAMKKVPGVEFARKYEEMVNSIRADMQEVMMLPQDANAMAKALIAEEATFWAAGGRQISDYVDINRKKFEQMEKNLLQITDKGERAIIENRIQYLHKGVSEHEKILKRLETVWDNEKEYYIGVQAEIAAFQDEFAGEAWNKQVERVKKANALAELHAQETMDLMRKAGINELDIQSEYDNKMRQLREREHGALMVALRDKVQAEMQASKETIDNLDVDTQIKIRLARDAQDKQIAGLEKFVQKNTYEYEVLKHFILAFWAGVIAAIDKGETAYDRAGKALGRFEEVFGALTSVLRDVQGKTESESKALEISISLFDTLATTARAAQASMEAFAWAERNAQVQGMALAVTLATVSATIGIIGAAIGLVVGIVSLFKKSAAEKQREEEERRAAAIREVQGALIGLGKVSEDTAEQILDDAEKYSKAAGIIIGQMDVMRLATAKNLSAVVDEVGVTLKNMNELWSYSVDVIKGFELGVISAKEAGDILSDMFDSILEGVQRLGAEGSAAMLEFIRTVRESGIYVESLANYISDQFDTAIEGLNTMLESINLEEGIRLTPELIAQYKGDLDTIAILTLETFNALIKEGKSYMEALLMMKEPLSALREKYKALGLEANDAVKQLMKIMEVAEANKGLLEAIEANRQILNALGNTAYLTEKAFKAVAKQARSYYDRLIKSGVDSKTALAMIVPTLADLVWYADQYGFKLDEATLKLIKQAKDAGVWKDRMKTIPEALQEGFDNVCDRLDDILDHFDKVFGYKKDLGDTWTDFNRGADNAIERVGRLRRELEGVGGGRARWEDGKAARGAQFGIRNVGDTELIRVHQGESILPQNLSDALRNFFGGIGKTKAPSESGMIMNTIEIDGRVFYKAISPYIKEGQRNRDLEIRGGNVF